MRRHFLWLGALGVAFAILGTPSATALRIEFDDANDIADWELGPNAVAEVADGLLELTVAGPQDSGIFFGDVLWTDYTMEVHARKQEGTPYFHLFVRTQIPAQDFYFMEISYNSDSTSVFQFAGAVGVEITGGARPARPASKDTAGGDAYTIVFEAEGETLRTFIDGELMVETTDATYPNGRPGLGGRDSTVWYDYVEINGPGIAPSPVEPAGKLAVVWGGLRQPSR
jgi:hypothetical protein